jgi:rod shape-determining protein MreC
MTNFAEILNKYKDYFIFLILLLISIAMLNVGNTNKISGFRLFLINQVVYLQDLMPIFANSSSIEAENEALREFNLKLSNELIKNRKAIAENDRLRGIIGFQETYEKDIIPAEVNGFSNYNFKLYITLSIGNKEGVQRTMPVRTDAGLVGTVIMASDNYSLVETLKNRDIKVSAKVLRSSVHGLIEWNGGENYILTNIPNSYDVEVGDIVTTSNYSNKYPDGIPIGEIDYINKSKNSLFLDIKVKPFVNYNSLTQCFVIKELPNPERDSLIRELERKLNL